MSMVMSWVIWCLALAGSAALYLFAPNGWVLALGAMVLLLPFLSFPGVWLVRRHLYASLELPETMEKKREAGLNVKLRNDCRFSAPCVQLVLRLENRLTGESGVRKLTFSVAANSTVSETIPFLPEYCGALSAELEKLCVRDVFRFWSAFRICGERQESLIVPNTFEPQLLLPMPSLSVSESEQYSQSAPGYDYAEVFQVRDYAEGDSPKQIHWKLSTKLDRMIVRDPSLPLDRWVLLIWERGNRAETAAQSDAMAETLVSVCHGLIRRNVGCRVVWMEEGLDGCTELTLREEQELYDALPKLLRAGKTEERVLTRYLQLFGAEKQNPVIVLTTEDDPLLTELCPEAHLTVLLCGAGTAPGRVYPFSAENLCEALGELNLT